MEERREQALKEQRREARQERRAERPDRQEALERRRERRAAERERIRALPPAERAAAIEALREERRQERAEAARQERRQERAEAVREERRERRLEALREQRRAERLEERRRELRREARQEERRRAERRAAIRADERRQERLRELRRELRRAERRNERLEDRQARLERQRAWQRQRLARLENRNRNLRQDLRWLERGDVVWRGPDRRIVRYGPNDLFVVNTGLDRLRFGAATVSVLPVGGGWTEHVVVRPNGVRIVTVRDANGFVVRRIKVLPDGRRIVLFDNRPPWWDDDGDVIVNVAPPRVLPPPTRYAVSPAVASPVEVYETLLAPPVEELDRPYTLNQILTSAALRAYMPRIDLDTITFETGSAEVPLDQIDTLEEVGIAMEEAVADNADELFLVEGHTDATGSATYNLALSDERAEAVAGILTEYFDIPPENLVTQGYGEAYLKVDTPGPSAENRRVAIRRITPLLGIGDDTLAALGPAAR